MDGVIVDSEPVHYEIETSVMRDLGVTISHKEYLTFVGKTARNMWSSLIERFELEISVDTAIQMSKDRYHHELYHTDRPHAIPGTVSLIQGLHDEGKNLVLASSSTLENIHIVLEKHNLKQYFSHIAGGDEVENGKPEPVATRNSG